MELFKTYVKDQEFIYLLDTINEDFGILGLNKDNTLVALFEPINTVQTLCLDGNVKADEIATKFGLTSSQSEAFREVLNHHIPNREDIEERGE